MAKKKKPSASSKKRKVGRVKPKLAKAMRKDLAKLSGQDLRIP